MSQSNNMTQENYQLLFENMISGCVYSRIITDKKGKPVNYKVLAVNKAYEKIIGKKSEEVVGQLITDIHPEVINDTIDWIGVFGRVTLSGESWESETYSEHADLWVRISAYSPKKGDFVMTFDDITENKKAEQENAKQLAKYKELIAEMMQMNERFNAFMDHVPVFVYIKDENLRHIYANKKMLQYANMDLKSFIGTSSKDFFSKEVAQKLETFDQKVKSDQVLVQTEDYIAAHDGTTHWIQDNKFPIKFPDNQSQIGGIAVDITALKKVEHDLNRQLEFEQKVSKISSRFINLPEDEIDASLIDGLRILAEILGMDRSFINQFSEDGNWFGRTHTWSMEDITIEDNLKGTDYSKTLPNYTKFLRSGGAIIMNTPKDIPSELVDVNTYVRDMGIQSAVVMPLQVGGKIIGSVGFDNLEAVKQFPNTTIKRLKLISEIFANALERKRTKNNLNRAFEEINTLKNHLYAENISLKEQIKHVRKFPDIVGESKEIAYVLHRVEQVAETDSTVLILGETGVGKERFANAVHEASKRKDKPMIRIDCTTLSPNLIESELFGHEKGAFTGAVQKQVGRFELANGATIFLDEIAELPLEVQSKLLRVLQFGEFEKLGNPKTIKTDVRIIAATNRDLEEEVRAGRFRQDLFYRLNVFPISIPPLRKRTEDIPLLLQYLLQIFNKRFGKEIDTISKENIAAIKNYSWPGNIRELENVIERAVIISNSNILNMELPQIPPFESDEDDKTMEEVERAHIEKMLNKSGWRISGPKGAALVLGLHPETLRSRIKKLGIFRP